MKKLLASIALLALTVPGFATELFVSPSGTDTNPGTKIRPLATLEAARDRLRAEKPGSKRLITLRTGVYARNKTLALDARDMGLTLRGEPGARLLGGKTVTGWQVSRDPRLPAVARGHVVQANLKAQGITNLGALRRRGFGVGTSSAPLELLANGKPLTLARWPNGDGWAKVAKAETGKFSVALEPERLARWAQAEDLWVHGYWTWDWADSVEKVAAIDLATQTLTTAPPHGVYGYQAGKRFYALNLIEELDAPGEYWLDRKTATLYAWLPDGTKETSVSLLETPLITVTDAKNITVERLTLEAGRGEGITISGGESVLVAGCTLKGLGTNGIGISGGKSHKVLSCNLSELGESGISVSGGDRMSLTPGGHVVENCDIHHHSRLCFTYRPAIGINGVGNKALHNHLHDGPHNAILMGGNDHLVAFNEIDRVCTQTGDAGAVYMGRNLTMRGTVIEYNWFHDIGPTLHAKDGFVDVMAVYLDDCFCGTTIRGNLFERAGRAAMIGGGRDNTIENNLFIGCNPAIHIDSRGRGWANEYFVPKGGWSIFETLDEVKPTQQPYATRYPALARLTREDASFAGGNILRNNIMVGLGKTIDWLDGLSETTVETVGNVSVKSGSEVGLNPKTFTVNVPHFTALPVAQFGLYKDAYRKR